MTATQQLVLFDADRIKDFVFATGRLKEIRGASQLVRAASDAVQIQATLGLAAEQIIFAEGGSGLLTATDATTAATLCRQLAQHYQTTTAGATLTAVHTPYTDSTFHDAVTRGARQLQLAKARTIGLAHSVQTPFTALCVSCGAQPATQLYGVTNTSTDLLCHQCYAKRIMSDTLRTRGQWNEDILLEKTDWGSAFLNSLPATAQAQWQTARLPESLTELATLARPGNYLALLYADGNGLGELVQQQTSKEGYAALSRRISTALHKALWTALHRHFPQPYGVEQHVPFEVIALGGDDLILVTVADQALPLALTLGELFTQYSHQDGEGAPLSLSFGVVIAHPGQPILNLEQQARNLLRNAKRRFSGQAAIDFHVVSTPILHEIDRIRAEAYTLTQAGVQVQLTARPLLLPQMATLLDHVRHFRQGGEEKALPHNKLHALYQALFTGEAAAEQEAFFLRSRLKTDQRSKFDAFFAAYGITLGTPAGGGPRLPWGQGPAGRFTPFADLVEIYPFVQPITGTTLGEESTYAVGN